MNPVFTNCFLVGGRVERVYVEKSKRKLLKGGLLNLMTLKTKTASK